MKEPKMKALLQRLPCLRLIIPTAVLIGAVPQYFTMWFVWRIVGLLLPNWIYQIGDDYVWDTYQRMVLFFYEHWIGTEVIFYGDAEKAFKNKERVLYISNHQSAVDWVVADMVAIRQGCLGKLRYIMKDGLQFIPSYGFYFYNHGCIYVRRGNFSPDKMMRGLDYLKNPKIPSWLVIFPEGTRYNPDAPHVIEKSKKYQEDEGLRVLDHHLCPKSRGLFLTLEKLRDNFDAVYDVTIVYENSVQRGVRRKAPQMLDFLQLEKPHVHVHINRIPMNLVPKTEVEMKTWLHNVFINKDKLVSKFYTKVDNNRIKDDEDGLFQRAPSKTATESFGVAYRRPLSVMSTLPVILVFGVTMMPMWAFPLGRSITWNLWLFGTLFGYTWLTIASVA